MHVVYNELDEFKKILEIGTANDFTVKAFNETNPFEEKRALNLKKYYGARMLPFVVLNINGSFKAFYTENGDVIDNLRNFFTGLKKADVRLIKEFTERCKDHDLSLPEIHKNIDRFYYNTIYDNKI